MAIKFNCPHCQKALSVKDESLAGKKAACTGCKKIVVIPQPAPAAPTEDVEALAAAALAEAKADPAGVPLSQTIDFECPACGEAVRMSRDLGGKNAPCPECKRIIKVPVPKIKDPADWRKKDDHLPAAARRDAEPAPEGAWEPSRAKLVSGQALIEAGVVKVKKKPGMTRRQKVYWGIAAAVAFVFLAVGGAVGWSSLAQGKQDKLVADAVKKVEDTARSREPAAEANRAAGEFFLRTGKREHADKARQAFAKARDLLEKSNPSAQRDLLLADLLRSQVDLAGNDEEVRAALRVKWDDVVQKELSPTLRHVSSSWGRLNALRAVTRKLTSRGHTEDAVKLARQPRSPGGAGADTLPNEAQEALAAVGAELFRARQKDLAGRLAEQAAASYLGAKPDTQPPLGPWVVALCVATGKPEPKPGKEKGDADMLAVGRAVGLALKEEEAGARNQQIASPEAHFMALVILASITRDPAADVAAAAALLEGDLNAQAVSPWLVYHLVEVAARTVPADRALRLAEHVRDPGLKARAHFEVVRARLEAAKDQAGDNVLDGIGNDPLLQALAREALARHNGRLNYGVTIKAVEAWDDAVRPFGTIGAVLGEQDAKGK